MFARAKLRAMSTTSLAQIPTLTQLYKVNELSPASSPRNGATSKYNDQISLIRTDITKLGTDAIVNAANSSLLGGGGVDGAIHKAAGHQLLEECRKLRGCDTGDAKITGAYRLPCKNVIHAVGPIYSRTKPLGQHTSLLQSCYTKSLSLAVESGCKSVAFSALSTGVYGYPSSEAAETAIAAVKEWLDEDDVRAQKLDRIVFCQFLQKDEDAYKRYIPEFFTSDSDSGETDESTEPVKPAEGSHEHSSNTAAHTSTAALKTNQLPDLPNVPSEAPKAPGQPDAKRAKLG